MIDQNGKVLFDSSADAAGMENHEGRAEVIKARESGFGEATRQSETLGQKTYYAAVRCEDGSVLRAAVALQSVSAVFVNNLPMTLGIVLLMVLVSIPLSRLITRRLLAPIMDAAQQISLEGEENIPTRPIYEEMEPFLNKIRAQKAQIAADFHRIQQEQGTVAMIISGMREGLILIDGDKNVLSCNEGAIHLLQAHITTNYIGHSVMGLCRDPEFMGAVNRAVHDQKASETVLEVGGLYLRVYVSPAEGVPGAMILIVDASAHIRAEQQRKDFSANVSHELKTPLTSISGFAEMIESGMAQQQDVAGFAGRIRLEASRLQYLIDDIMFQSGRMGKCSLDGCGQGDGGDLVHRGPGKWRCHQLRRRTADGGCQPAHDGRADDKPAVQCGKIQPSRWYSSHQCGKAGRNGGHHGQRYRYRHPAGASEPGF